MAVRDMPAGELLFKLVNPYAPTVQLQKHSKEIAKLKKKSSRSTTTREGGGGRPQEGGGKGSESVPVPELDSSWVTVSTEWTADGVYQARLAVEVPPSISAVRGFIGYRMALTRNAYTDVATTMLVEGSQYPYPGYSTLTLPLNVASVGETVAVQLQVISSYYGEGGWSGPLDVLVGPDTTPPADPTITSVASKGGALVVTFDVPTDPDYRITEFVSGYSGGLQGPADWPKVGESSTGVASIPWDIRSDTLFVKDTIAARHIDRSGNASDWTSYSLTQTLVDDTMLGGANLDIRGTLGDEVVFMRDADGHPRLVAYMDAGDSTYVHFLAVPYISGSPDWTGVTWSLDDNTAYFRMMPGGLVSLQGAEMLFDAPTSLTITTPTVTMGATGALNIGGTLNEVVEIIAPGGATSGGSAINSLKFSMQNDFFGDVEMEMLNRNNNNGVKFTLKPDNTAIQLIDFIFGHPGGQRNIRLEGRVAECTTGIAQEWQFGNPGGASMHTAMSDNGLYQRVGYIAGNSFVGRGKSSTNAWHNMAKIVPSYYSTTEASWAGQMVLYASDYTGDREAIRIQSKGTSLSLSFFGATPQSKPTVSGSRGGNAALASLLTALSGYGLITDSTSA